MHILLENSQGDVALLRVERHDQSQNIRAAFINTFQEHSKNRVQRNSKNILVSGYRSLAGSKPLWTMILATRFHTQSSSDDLSVAEMPKIAMKTLIACLDLMHRKEQYSRKVGAN